MTDGTKPSSDTGQSRLSGSRRPDGHELGIECDVESCDERVVGLDDGWEYDRGIVCSSCIKYRHQHHHWPDEDVETCRECILDDDGAVHDCPENSIDVLLRPGDGCPNCGFELAVTDGGIETDDTEQSPFDQKVESIATVLDEFPPMQILKAVEKLAEDDGSKLHKGDLVTAASNVAEPEDLIDAATVGERSVDTETASKGDSTDAE